MLMISCRGTVGVGRAQHRQHRFQSRHAGQLIDLWNAVVRAVLGVILEGGAMILALLTCGNRTSNDSSGQS